MSCPPRVPGPRPTRNSCGAGRARTLRATALPPVLLLLATACGGPVSMMPGGALRGEVVEEPVDDWSFASDRFGDRIHPGTALQVTDPEERRGFDPDRIVYRIESRAE